MKVYAVVIFAAVILSSCAGKNAPGGEPLSERGIVEYDLAYDALTRGQLIPALGAITRALEASPNSFEARNLKGLILFRQRKFDEAEVEFQKAIQLNPKYTEALLNLGATQHAQEKFLEAIKTYEMALQNPLYLYPERIYNNMGLAYARLKNYDKAQESFQQAIQLKPDQFMAYQNLGKLFFEKGELKKAEAPLKEAARLCAECVEPRYHLGLIYMKNDRKDVALRFFREGSKLDPRGYFGNLCRQYLLPETETEAQDL